LRGRYVALYRDVGRGMASGGGYHFPDGYRTIATATSEDFIQWTWMEDSCQNRW